MVFVGLLGLKGICNFVGFSCWQAANVSELQVQCKISG